jgi:hypothetical protein
MPTFTRGKTYASTAKLPPVRRAMESGLASYNNTPPARQLLRWAKPTGEVRLVKMGPRNPPTPKMGDKLAALAARFNH